MNAVFRPAFRPVFEGVFPFRVSRLFANNEQGVWYDPSDMTTLFQDSAGTTPVTAPGQPVGLVLDKSGNGNHAAQSTAGSRPTYGIVPETGRRNLLTYTEQFDSWSKSSSSVVADAAVAPDGTTTADEVTFTSNVGNFAFIASYPSIAAGAHTASIYIRAFPGEEGKTVTFDYTGVATGSQSITLSSSWQRVTRSFTAGSAGFLGFRIISYTGQTASKFYLWGAQLEAGSAPTNYQRVGTKFDVTEAGVRSLSYLSFDGSGDWLVTPTITPNIDKAQIFAGVRKLSDASLGMVVESSINIGGNNGSLRLAAPGATAATYNVGSRGTTLSQVTSPADYPAPITNVTTGVFDIAGDNSTLRVDGLQVAQSTADQGTGDFLAYPLYIGMRAGISLPFNGQLYGLIVRFGSNLSTRTIEQVETYVAAETGINF